MNTIKRTISIILVVVMIIPAFCLTSSAREAIDMEEARIIINAQTLNPQKTGYTDLDLMIDEILMPFSDGDTFTKILGLYDWCVNNVDYSWDGYTQHSAPAYDKFGLDYDLENDPSVISPYPKDMINRAYHSLTDKTGVCYDYAILFSMMARYVGIESYVHTGILTIGAWTGHHGWSELILNGYAFIFDAQQDYREVYTRGGDDPHAHFCIPTPNARWAEEYYENDKRDESLLSINANQAKTVNIKVISSYSGKVKSLTPNIGTNVTLKSDTNGKKVAAWYCNGKLISDSEKYSFTANNDALIYAIFEGDTYVDVTNDWYLDSVLFLYNKGIMTGTSAYEFSPEMSLTRAMFVKMLAYLDGVDLSKYNKKSQFKDVISDSWYASSVNWAYKNGITAGISNDMFKPDAKLTREQTVALVVRYLKYRGYQNINGKTDLSAFCDVDKISEYAVEDLKIGIALGIISGYNDKTLKPCNDITRAESAVMVTKLVKIIEEKYGKIAA